MELERLCIVKKAGQCPYFENVVLVDGVTSDAARMAKEAGLQVMSFAKVEAVGAQRIATEGHKHRPPTGKDVFTFCYTSGTTGEPKGALLTHENLISAIAGLDNYFSMGVNDRHLSYLPLAHVYERINMATSYTSGASVAFFRGDPLLLIEDIQACRPTFLAAVPRVLNKIYDKIHTGVAAAGGMKKKLFDAAVTAKTKNLKATGQLKHAFYDRIIFNKIKNGLGLDCLRVMGSGSAPLASTVMNFFRIMLGVPVLEGYGQTESAGVSSVSLLEDMSTAGHVGIPTSAVEIVLMDVPEMGYLHTDSMHKSQPCQGRGEICIRGPTVFTGYYKQPEKTKEVIDEEGWLHTGDVGLWTVDGNLQIVDRKKNIFKLSQGEYVAPEKIENVVIQSLLVGQAFVYGDSFQNYVVAVLVPDEEPVRKVLEDLGESTLAKAAFSDICKTEKLKNAIATEINQLAKANGLHGFEIPRAIHLAEELFSVENGLLTPTFKLKRQQARDKYAKEIERMYTSMAKPQSKI
jgi:long-chain acyl-CoA synthetase